MKLVQVLARICIGAILFGVLLGCNPGNLPTPSVSLLPSPTLSKTVTSEILQTSTVTPDVITQTPKIALTTPIPSKTATIALKNTITLTSQPSFVPTRSEEERRNWLLSQLEMASGCELPCWWEVQPGNTNWAMVADYYFNNGMSPEKYKNTYELRWRRIPFQNKTIGFGITYILNGQIIDALSLGAQMSDEKTLLFNREIYELFPDFRMDAILNHLGEPESIKIFTSGKGNESGQIFFGLLLDYRSSGISLLYEGIAAEQGDSLLFCPQDTSFNAFLWNPEKSDPNIVFQSKSNLFIPTEYMSLFKELNQVTTLENDDFLTIYLSRDTQKCIATPLDKWLP